MSERYLEAALQAERKRREREDAIRERAQLIARMLLGDNETAKAQAVQAIERGCWAEETLAAVRALPSGSDLLGNAVARAMYELAGRTNPGASL